MKITNFAIRHATAVFVLIACIIGGGIYAYESLPKEAAPDVQFPLVFVSTAYTGVSSADIESLVTDPLEREFQGLKDVEEMSSTSAESVSLVTLEFDPSVDIDEALQKVRADVDSAETDLPEDAEDPQIIELNSSDFPVMIANVTGDFDPERLKSVAEDLEDDLEAIQGVLRVELNGGVTREIQVRVHPGLLRYHKVSVGQVIGAIQSENVNLPGGGIDVGDSTYTVRVPGEYDDPNRLENIVVKSSDGLPVFLRDVATVVDDYKERETFSRLTNVVSATGDNTSDATGPNFRTRSNISLSILKRSGENILRVAGQSREIIEEYEEKYAQSDLDIVILNDSSDMIEARVTELQNNIISGLLLVLVLLFFFMGGARNALFVGVAIPLSMLMSFLILFMMGVTLNIVVLFSLVLALGMLVDNAIVVVENIYRHANEGKSRMQAAMDGTWEVGWAITASTATTVGAFAPLLFWPGLTGEFMRYLPLTVIVVLLSSLFVALVINPTLCASLLKVRDDVSFSEAEVPDNIVYRVYRTVLEWSIRHRAVVMIAAIGTLVGSTWAFVAADQGVEFFPQTTPEKFNIEAELPDGTRLESTDELVKKLEEPLDQRPELVEAWVANIGTQGGGRAAGGGQAPHYANISVDLVDVEDQRSDPDDFIQELRNEYAEIPGATISISKQSMGPPSGPPINIEIIGRDLETLKSLAREVKSEIRGIPGVIDLRDNLELTRPEIHVDPLRKQAALSDISTRDIAQTVRTAIAGTEASNIRDREDEYDVTVRMAEPYRDDPEDLEQLTVTNDDNEHIPLTEVSNIDFRSGSGSIRHIGQERVVTVTASAADGYLAADLLDKARQKLSDKSMPAGYEIRYTGESEDREEAANFLSGALLAGLFLIMMVLVTEFNSVVQPLIILLSVLLSLIGVFWILLLTGEPFGILMTGIGIISLAGVVVNNSIVMVDYINKLRERDWDRRDAVIQGGLVRFRPVMLTAFTTALGLVPIVIGVSLDFVNAQIVVGGTSVEMWGPMARAVTSGLMVATVLTLVVVPVMYSLFDDLGQIGERWFPGEIPGRSDASSTAMIIGLSAAAMLGVSAPSQTAVAQSDETGAVDDRPVDTTGEDAASQDDSRRDSVDADDDTTWTLTDEALDEADIEADRDLSLEKARDRVRTENFDVKIAATRIAEADAQIQRAYGIVLPEVSASGSYTIHDREIRTEFGGDFLPPGTEAPSILVRPKTDYQWSGTASVRLNARAYPLIKQAARQKELSQAQQNSLRQELEFAVTEAYYNLLTIRRVMELSAERLASRKRRLNVTKRRLDAGVANKFEKTRAELRVVQAEKELDRSRLNFIRVRRSLANTLQTDPDFDVQAPPSPAEPDGPDELVDRAVDQRFDLEARDLSIAIAQRSIDEMWAQYLPSLGANFRVFGAKDTALSVGGPQWSLSFNANWVLWSGGQRRAQINQRQAQRESAKIEKRKLRAKIESDIDQAWAQYESARAQVESGETEVELARQTLNQTEIAYKNGTATQLDIIDAEDRVRQAELTLIQDRLNLELAARRLQYLAGWDGDSD